MPEFLQFGLELLKEKHEQEIKDRIKIQANIEKQLDRMQKERDKLIDMRLNDLLTDTEYLISPNLKDMEEA